MKRIAKSLSCRSSRQLTVSLYWDAMLIASRKKDSHLWSWNTKDNQRPISKIKPSAAGPNGPRVSTVMGLKITCSLKEEYLSSFSFRR